ncbi:MAG: glycosyltransferase family 1 protein [Dehalococcoidia bacterium]|nr:glycosyltransferase family 1 protein [Dehalococcoidia bacterium]
MAVKSICICSTQVPFNWGGAELLVGALRQALASRGYDTDVISIPFKWYPKEEIITHALAWRLIDIEESNGRPIDMVIATKFPSYMVRHSKKVVWLVQQFRQAYDLFGTPYGDLGSTKDDQRIREMIHDMDNNSLNEADKIFAISNNVRERLLSHNGIDSDVLYPPPKDRDYRCDGYGDYILSVGRLESLKRTSLLIEAVARVREARCTIVGVGPEEAKLRELTRDLEVEDRVRFTGYVDDATLVGLYANCLGVFYAPYDEDLGLVPVEAFKSKKPVITTSDSGGVLEWVLDGRNGAVTEPNPENIADGIASLYKSSERAAKLGEDGWLKVKDVTWDTVVDTLLQ